jgi:TPR repeat protein
MRHILVLGFAVASIVLLYPPGGAKAAGRQDPPLRLSADLDLNEAQQAQLATQAISGSRDAARQLANFHYFGRGDRTATLKWFTIGAENGDPGCEFGLYTVLSLSKDETERQRSLFWLHKAADDGLESAKAELKAIGMRQAKPVPTK